MRVHRMDHPIKSGEDEVGERALYSDKTYSQKNKFLLRNIEFHYGNISDPEGYKQTPCNPTNPRYTARLIRV